MRDLPTTDDFVKSALNKEVISQSYLECMADLLGDNVNIEEIAQRTSRLMNGIKAFIPNDNSPSPLRSIIHFQNEQWDFMPANEIVKKLQNQLKSINEHVIYNLNCDSDSRIMGSRQKLVAQNIDEIKDFLQTLKENFNFKIFSTNYDNLIRQIHPNPRYYIETESAISSSIVNIRKLIKGDDNYAYIPLKGMIDWRRSRNGIIIEGHEYEKNYDNQVIMPLEDTSTPERHPHKEMYDALIKEIKESHMLLFIGFSFRDTFINNLLQSYHNEDLTEQIIIVTKSRRIPENNIFKKKIENEIFNRLSESKITYHNNGMTAKIKEDLSDLTDA